MWVTSMTQMEVVQKERVKHRGLVRRKYDSDAAEIEEAAAYVKAGQSRVNSLKDAGQSLSL